MLFHVHYTYTPTNRNQVHQRFLDTGGAPAEGVKMLGRWHSVEGNNGFLIAESNDAGAIGSWLQDWTDLVSFEVSPVIEDDQFATLVQ